MVVYSLANIVERCAAGPGTAAELFLEDLFLSPQLSAAIPAFDARGVATLFYSCSLLGVRSPQLIGRLLAAATRHMDAYNGPELSSLVVACVRLGAVPNAAFFTAWARRMHQCMAATAAAGGLTQSDYVLTTGLEETVAGVGRKYQQPAASPRRAALGFGAASTAAASQHRQQQQQQSHHRQTNDEVDEVAASGHWTQQQLSGSVLAVCSWSVCKLGLVPARAWITTFVAAMERVVLPPHSVTEVGSRRRGAHLVAQVGPADTSSKVSAAAPNSAPLSHQELIMLMYALGHWQVAVSCCG